MNKKIGKQFFEEIDSYIKKNLQTLTCSQIYDFYYFFWEHLREFKGNSNGFTGLSELLVFRSLYHLLGGSFKRIKASRSNWIYEFESNADKGIRIGQSVPIYINDKRIYPDITINNLERLKAVAQIKLYLTGGINEVFNEIEKLKALRANYMDLRALLIIFELSKEGKIINQLKELKDNLPWFHFDILKQNNDFITTVLTKGLGLNEFIKFKRN